MARPIQTVRKIPKNLSLTEGLIAKMELELFSEAEGRVPMGAQSELVEALLWKHFKKVDRLRKQAANGEAVKIEALTEGEGGA